MRPVSASAAAWTGPRCVVPVGSTVAAFPVPIVGSTASANCYHESNPRLEVNMKDGRTVVVSAEDTWSSSDCLSGTSVLHDGSEVESDLFV